MTHVDDLLEICQENGGLEEFKEELMREFNQITYHEEEISFLGMAIERSNSGEVFLSQPGYAAKICREERNDRIYTTPGNAQLFSDPDDQTVVYEHDVTFFRSQLMSMMFLATRTRPDILKECTFLASFGCNPGKRHSGNC